MSLTRRSGILLHPSSLPGPYGIGEFGPAALEWLEFLAAAEQSVWQMLPVNPVGADGCPYQSHAALAGNPLLISVDRLVDDGLLASSDLDGLPELPRDRVGYEAAAAVKEKLLAQAFANFTPTDESTRFNVEHRWWLDDYALYMALRRRYGGEWTRWPQPLARRDPGALDRFAEAAAHDIDYYRFEQYVFAAHYAATRARARELGIEILGDIAMFLGTQSVEVWSRPELFQLDSAGNPTAVAGFPPDEFSRDGQVWGNALYRWNTMAADGYGWWIDRVRRMSELFDIVRLDHFRGFHRYWAVPVPGTATQGRWEEGPGIGLFQAIRKELGDVNLIAEDLGPASVEVQQLRVDGGIPGMRLLQFAFAGDENQHLPHYYPVDCVAYSGTHDTDTTTGWWEAATADERERAEQYLGGVPDGICWAAARAIFGSVAYLAILPLQDVLQLGGEARFNTPGRAEGNWQWRFDSRALTPSLEFRLRRLTECYGRDRLAARRRARGFTG